MFTTGLLIFLLSFSLVQLGQRHLLLQIRLATAFCKRYLENTSPLITDRGLVGFLRWDEEWNTPAILKYFCNNFVLCWPLDTPVFYIGVTLRESQTQTWKTKSSTEVFIKYSSIFLEDSRFLSQRWWRGDTGCFMSIQRIHGATRSMAPLLPVQVPSGLEGIDHWQHTAWSGLFIRDWCAVIALFLRPQRVIINFHHLSRQIWKRGRHRIPNYQPKITNWSWIESYLDLSIIPGCFANSIWQSPLWGVLFSKGHRKFPSIILPSVRVM